MAKAFFKVIIAEKQVAEVVVGLGKVGLHVQGYLIEALGSSVLASLEKHVRFVENDLRVGPKGDIFEKVVKVD